MKNTKDYMKMDEKSNGTFFFCDGNDGVSKKESLQISRPLEHFQSLIASQTIPMKDELALLQQDIQTLRKSEQSPSVKMEQENSKLRLLLSKAYANMKQKDEEIHSKTILRNQVQEKTELEISELKAKLNEQIKLIQKLRQEITKSKMYDKSLQKRKADHEVKTVNAVEEHPKSSNPSCGTQTMQLLIIDRKNQTISKTGTKPKDLSSSNCSLDSLPAKKCGNYLPMVKIVGAPLELEENEDFLMSLRQNNELPTDACVEVIGNFTVPTENSYRRNVIIRTTIEIQEQLCRMKCLPFQNMTAYCFEYMNPLQCWKCNKFGHIAKNCKNSECCKKCAGPHPSKDCKSNDTLKCINCSEKLRKNHNHAASYEGCPIYQDHLFELKCKGKRLIGLFNQSKMACLSSKL